MIPLRHDAPSVPFKLNAHIAQDVGDLFGIEPV